MKTAMSSPWRQWGAALATAGLAGSLAVAAGVPAQAAPLDDLVDDLALHYDFSEALEGGTVVDKSANGFDGTVDGSGASVADGAITLTDDTFVEIPGAVFEGNDTLTISSWLRNDMPTGGNYNALYFGLPSGPPPAQYWLLNPANGDGEIKSVFTNTLNAGAPWTTEVGNIGPDAVDGFALYTTVITPTSLTNYLNGELTGTTTLSRTVTQLGSDLIGYIGTSPYRGWGDPIWDGAVKDLKVFTAAMTEQQVSAQYYEELGDTEVSQVAVDEDAAALAVADTAETDIELPTVGTNGSEIVWSSSHPAIIATDGSVTQPSADTDVTLTADLTLGGAVAQRTFTVTVTGDGSIPPVAHYRLNDTTGTVAVDSSGNGNDATYVGGPTLQGDAGVRLDGTDDYVDLPDNLVTGIDSITVSMDVLIRTGQQTPYFIWNIGNPATSNSGTGYMMATGNAYRHTITPGNWSGEQNATSGANLQRGVWKTITYTIDAEADAAVTYLDGVQVGQSASTTVTPGSLGGGVTTANYIGRSAYGTDRLLAGSVRDFRLYDSALTADQVASLVPSDATRVERDAAALNLGDTSAVTEDLTLPATGINGSTVTWGSSDEATVDIDGTVTRPAALEDDATVTLTATVTRGAEQDTREFTVTVLAESDAQSIADGAAAAIEVTNIDDVRGNLFLPTEVEGLPVTWESADEAIVTADGIVNRPDTDTDVVLTATVTNGDVTATREFTAQVLAAIELAPFEGYGFSYFVNNSVEGEKIYFAASRGNDALSWDELNGGAPTLESEYGTRGLRDPFIIRSPEGDKFYMIATDLSIGRNGDWGEAQRFGSQYLEVWESYDLVNWSEQRHVKVAPDNAGNTWAPEAYYDESIGEYVVFWASKRYAEDDPNRTAGVPNEMLYSTTRDFVNFSEPQGWQTGISRIDSSVLEVDGTYHRFTKDEGAGTTGCSDIIHEYSDELRAPLDDWTMLASCIGRDAGTGAVEGPSIFKSNPGDVNGDKYYLFVDEYGGRGYIPLETEDIANPDWQVSDDYDLPASPRHGTVFPVTAAELEAMRSQIDVAEPVTSDEEGQVLRYDFDSADGTTLTDVTGNGYDGSIVGGATPSDGALAFTGDDYVDLPNNIMAGLEDITIEAEVYLDPALSGNYFIYGLGNTDGGGVGNGYLFSGGNPYRTSIATGNWTTEQTVSQGSNLPRGQWVQMVYTLSGNTARLYLDGVQVATSTVTTNPGDIGGGFTSANHLGRSNYNADGLFRGQYREFAIWDRALSAEEVLAGSGQTDVLLGVTLADESVLKIDPIVNTSTNTVVFPVIPGTDLTSLAPVFDTVEGVTSDPASGSVQDLSSEVTYQLSGESDATWTMSAVEMRSPVLPGKYADPNIIVFGDTYYIYATSDGYPGWGGNEFYTWKSTNLVDWERAEEPFLTLDGEDGNVPWATGNAWAPTAIERDGKYYFYFSGHNAQLNRKTIGVAVADHPEGPFVAEPQAMILNNESVTSGQAIDPHAFKDPVSGKHYIYWGNGSPVMAELADDMVSLKAGTLRTMPGLTGYREGTFMVYREGLYHATYSIDDTGSENYRVGYATSTTPEGPWTYRGVILQKDPSLGILGTGHNSIVNVPGTDDWYIAYHRFAIPGGNGTNRETTIDRLTFDENTGLMQTVTPTLGSVDPQEIEQPEATIESIEVTQLPTTTEYMVGDELDLDGLEVTATWSDDATEVLSSDEFTVTGFDSSTPGDVTLTVTLTANETITTSFDVTVSEEPVEPVVESIAVTQSPNKTEYLVGEELDLDGLEVTATWSDDATEVLSSDDFTVTGFDSSAPATVMVSVTLTDDPTITTSFIVTVKAAPVEFVDVAGSEHAAGIEWLASEGISTGWSTDEGQEFRPFANITRDAMAAFLYRYADSPEVDTSGGSPFVDVDESLEHYEAILWLADQGITEGWETTEGTEFRPFEPITRDAMAAFLYRMADEPRFFAPVVSPFEDITTRNTEFYKEITWLEDTGITEGWAVDNGYEFRPFNTTTRDAMATFLYRFHQLPS